MGFFRSVYNGFGGGLGGAAGVVTAFIGIHGSVIYAGSAAGRAVLVEMGEELEIYPEDGRSLDELSTYWHFGIRNLQDIGFILGWVADETRDRQDAQIFLELDDNGNLIPLGVGQTGDSYTVAENSALISVSAEDVRTKLLPVLEAQASSVQFEGLQADFS